MASAPTLNEAGRVTTTMVIIDDDSGFRRAAAGLFESRGVHVLAYSVDGTSGIDAVRRHRPAWVLLDVNLPDQDGLTVARALRQHAPSSSILLTSTGESPWSETELAEAGVRMYVDKDRLSDPEILNVILRENSA